jgi:predicted DNA-binding transcriptional regulator AlpA
MSVWHDEKATAARLGVSTRTLQRWRRDGSGPAYMRAGPRAIRYSDAALEEWSRARTFRHRAAELRAHAISDAG